MFEALQAAGLTLEPSKVEFEPREVKHLGRILTADVIRIGADRLIKAIVDLPTPETIKELRSILGMVNFFRMFIPNLASVIASLVALKNETLKEVATRWNSEYDRGYATIKKLLSLVAVQKFPGFSHDFAIHVNASEASAGVFLAQQKGDDIVIIACFGQRFNWSQRRYSATLRECYAVELTIQHWRPYLWGRHFVCVTDLAALR